MIPLIKPNGLPPLLSKSVNPPDIASIEPVIPLIKPNGLPPLRSKSVNPPVAASMVPVIPLIKPNGLPPRLSKSVRLPVAASIVPPIASNKPLPFLSSLLIFLFFLSPLNNPPNKPFPFLSVVSPSNVEYPFTLRFPFLSV